MGIKMRKAINVLYPDEFQKKAKRVTKTGFFSSRWKALKLYVQELGKLKILIAASTVAGLLMFSYSVYAYNHITAYVNAIYSAASNVNAESQRRNDLINNLVPPTLNYSIFEKELFSHVVEIRKELTNLSGMLKESPQDNSVISAQLKTQLPALLGIFENYPDLKASQPFADLMKELIETENRIAASRANMNEKTRIYNTYIAKLPAAWVARLLRFKARPWFEPTGNALIVPDMKILDSVNKKAATEFAKPQP